MNPRTAVLYKIEWEVIRQETYTNGAEVVASQTDSASGANVTKVFVGLQDGSITCQLL